MRPRSMEKAGKAMTTVVVAALVCATGVGISGLVMSRRPAFALTSTRDFAITSQVYASTCSSTAGAKLEPGVTRCLAVTVDDPLSVDIDVTALSMAVSFAPTKTNHDTPACKTTMLRGATTRPLSSALPLPSAPVTAGKAEAVDLTIKLTTTPATTQAACENGNFNFTFSGSAHYTDTTRTVLKGTLTGTSVALTATVTPANPTTDAFGPAGVAAPTNVVRFYSCVTATCLTRTTTPLATETLKTSGKATKSATASYTVTDVSGGPHYFDAVYPGTAATPDFLGSTSNIVTETVVTTLPAVCTGKTFQHHIIDRFPFFVVFGTNQSDLIVVGNGNYFVNGLQGTDCIVAGNGNDVLIDGTGNDGVQAGNGRNEVFLGNGNDKVSLGNGTDWLQARNGNDTVTEGNGWSDQVFLGGGTDTVVVGNGWHDTVRVWNGNDTVTVGSGSYDFVSLGNGDDTVTLQSPGSHDTIHAGTGVETIHLGGGTSNAFIGFSRAKDTCSVPTPPSTYHGTPAGYYHDVVFKCTVVTT